MSRRAHPSPTVSRRPQALATLLALLVCPLGSCGLDRPPKRPNVLIVVMDTTRADVLSSYGHPKPTTPHADQLAREGARFSQAIAPDFWTLPSHASLLTGQYPSRHQATSETNHLPGNVLTLAERLRAAGYHTAAFVSNAWLSAERGFAQGFEDYSEAWRERGGDGASSVVDRRTVAIATQWISEHAGAHAPFFVFVNLMTPHLPYTPDPLTLVALTPEPRPMDRVVRLMKIKGTWSHLAGTMPLDALDLKILRELYEAEVAMADSLVGRLLASLRETGVLDGTLVVLTSDHGENIGEHDMLDHVLSMYDTTLHVPLVLRYPPAFAPGTVRDELVSLVDIVPTVLELCDIDDRTNALAGHSLVPGDRAPAAFVIAENERPSNSIALLQKLYPNYDSSPHDERLRALRNERHKLIWHSKAAAELYDLQADPGETDDLAARRPELRDELLAQLQHWMAAQEADHKPDPFESRDASALEQLRALGYLR